MTGLSLVYGSWNLSVWGGIWPLAIILGSLMGGWCAACSDLRGFVLAACLSVTLVIALSMLLEPPSLKLRAGGMLLGLGTVFGVGSSLGLVIYRRISTEDRAKIDGSN